MSLKPLLLCVLADSAFASTCTSPETCGEMNVLLQSRTKKKIVEKLPLKPTTTVAVGKVEDAQNQDALLALGHSVGAVQTSMDASRQMLVTFNHEGREYQYKLAPHSVYAKTAQVYKDGVLLEKGAFNQPRNFKAMGNGKRASMTLFGDKQVRGLFEHDGRVLEVTPIAHLRDPSAALLQPSSNHSQAQPAHLIRWVAAPELGTLGKKKFGLSLSVTKQRKVGNETHGFYGGTSGIADFGTDGSDMPVDTHDGRPFQSDEGGHPLAEFWHGAKWWPGCYRDDYEMQEFVLTIVADKAAWDGVPDHWDPFLTEAAHTDKISDEKRTAALQGNIESIVEFASFVYEMQLNINLKIGHLAIDTTGSEYGECAADEMYERLHKMKELIETGRAPPGAASHFFTGCGSPLGGLAGLAYRGKICEDEWGVGSVKLYSIGHTWLTFAHELGHNFGAGHSFEHGEGSTGGIMDYGDGTLDGEYQFNDYRRNEICSKIDSVVNQCEGNFQKHPNPGSLFPDIPGMIGPDEDPFAEGGAWDLDFPIFTPPPIQIPAVPDPLPECQGDRFTWASGRGGCWEYQNSLGENVFHDFWCTQDRQTDTPPGGIPENGGLYAGDVCSECGRCRDKVYTEPYLCSWKYNQWCRCHGEMYLGKKYVSGSSGALNTFEQMKQGKHVSTPLNPSMAKEKRPLERWTLPTGGVWAGSFSATKLKCKSGNCPYTAGTFVPKVDASPEACWCDPSVPSTALGPVTDDGPTQAPVQDGQEDEAPAFPPVGGGEGEPSFPDPNAQLSSPDPNEHKDEDKAPAASKRSSMPCHDTCEPWSKPWSEKCMKEKCAGCSNCAGMKLCAPKCDKNGKPWTKKCKWKVCLECDQCL